MKFKLELNKISIKPAAVVKDLTPYLKKALDYAEEFLIDLMKKAIDETSTAPHNWRDALKKDLRHVEDIITKDMIRYTAGVEYPEESGAWMRAMVIAYGMGKLGLNGNEIMAGPEGRIVWDKELENRVPSKVKDEHEIPQSWYHAGGRFIHNAISNMRIIFRDAIEEALGDMDLGKVFYNNLTVRKR